MAAVAADAVIANYEQAKSGPDGRGGQVLGHGLERSPLPLIRLARYRRVEVADLHGPAGELRARDEHALGPGHFRPRLRVEPLARGQQHAEATVGLEPHERVV